MGVGAQCAGPLPASDQYNGDEVTSYFNDLQDTVAHATNLDDASFVKVVADVEKELIVEVVEIAEDEEFPSALMTKMKVASKDLGVWLPNKKVDVDTDEYRERVERVLLYRKSLLIGVLHSMFHDLDRKKIKARFGMLTDDPHDMLARRKDYSEHRAHLYGDSDWTLEEMEWVSGFTHPIPRVTSLATMMDDIVKDKTGVPPDSQINARLASLIFACGLRTGSKITNDIMDEKLKTAGVDIQFIEGVGIAIGLPSRSIDINLENIDEIRNFFEQAAPQEETHDEGSEATDDEN
jgi:hypothetical protein